MKYFVYLDGKVIAENGSLEAAEAIAREKTVESAPKMVSIRDDAQKKGDPARRTYAVRDGVMKWSRAGDTRIEIGEDPL